MMEDLDKVREVIHHSKLSTANVPEQRYSSINKN